MKRILPAKMLLASSMAQGGWGTNANDSSDGRQGAGAGSR